MSAPCVPRLGKKIAGPVDIDLDLRPILAAAGSGRTLTLPPSQGGDGARPDRPERKISAQFRPFFPPAHTFFPGKGVGLGFSLCCRTEGP